MPVGIFAELVLLLRQSTTKCIAMVNLAIRVLCPNLKGEMHLISELSSQRNSLLVYYDPRQCGNDWHHQLRYWQMRWKHQLRLLASTIHWTAMPSFFAGGCLGWSRAERPSVSWTKVLETLCLQQPKEMFNIKNSGKNVRLATSTNKYSQSSKQNFAISSSFAWIHRRGLRWNPKESTYARVGRCNQRKRALVKPEGSTLCQSQKCTSDTRKGKVWTNCRSCGH